MEPSEQDVNAVSQMLDNSGQQPAPAPAPAPQPTQQPTQQPAPQAPAYTPGISQPAPTAPQPQAPAQQQPTAPVQQPAPTSQPQDPFSMFGAQPTPQTQAPAPQPTPQPIEQPTPQPTQTPTEPAQPAPQAQPTAPQQPQYQTFDQYIESVTSGIADPTTEMPDPSKIDPNDEAGIKNFFDGLVETAVQKASAASARTVAIQNSERALWDNTFVKYPSLRDNKNLRDMVHAIRMSEFDKGIAITPVQAAERLLDALKGQYQRGIADNQVQTTIESVQPNGGGGQAVETTQDMQNVLTSVQSGGETALAAYLDTQVKAGKI